MHGYLISKNPIKGLEILPNHRPENRNVCQSHLQDDPEDKVGYTILEESTSCNYTGCLYYTLQKSDYFDDVGKALKNANSINVTFTTPKQRSLRSQNQRLLNVETMLIDRR